MHEPRDRTQSDNDWRVLQTCSRPDKRVLHSMKVLVITAALVMAIQRPLPKIPFHM